MRYADIVVGLSLEKLDRTFQYSIPQDLYGEIRPGVRVIVPFGRRDIEGFVISLSDSPAIDIDRIRPIKSICKKAITIEENAIALADWMRRRYGCTMNQALQTVLPAKRTVRKGKTRVGQISLDDIDKVPPVRLNDEQRTAVEGIMQSFPRPSLLFGVTGSGKTEVYMELMERVFKSGRQSILLIPEISLTAQNVKRFAERFGSGRIGIINSRQSEGERYECFHKARMGELDLVIGPRSALFVPFPKLGLIIVDEEHDGAYNSGQSPKYRGVEVAAERARREGALLVLGSATPSVGTYKKALDGEYALFRLEKRAVGGSVLPSVGIVDMRKELIQGRRGIFSNVLHVMINEKLEKGEQVMLFLNRRGYSGFVSCRSCGTVIKCRHCDVAMTAHRGGILKCHYCGNEARQPQKCPECGSPFIGGFGIGTQKVENAVLKEFPNARVLRLDYDTVRRKGEHARILSEFAAHKADILIGTQMIVKGHDFPNVTLMGILAADLSLYTGGYTSAERTFQLLVQASGRSGRSVAPGDVIIQTYSPDAYAVRYAAENDYESFYEKEISYRMTLSYPPFGGMLEVLASAPGEEEAQALIEEAAGLVRSLRDAGPVRLIGPADAQIAKIKDRYRKVIYLKHTDEAVVLRIRDVLAKKYGMRLQFELM